MSDNKQAQSPKSKAKSKEKKQDKVSINLDPKLTKNLRRSKSAFSFRTIRTS